MHLCIAIVQNFNKMQWVRAAGRDLSLQSVRTFQPVRHQNSLSTFNGSVRFVKTLERFLLISAGIVFHNEPI